MPTMIEKMTNKELDELIRNIEHIKEKRANEKLQEAQTEIREVISKYREIGISFIIADGYGGGQTIYADSVYSERWQKRTKSSFLLFFFKPNIRSNCPGRASQSRQTFNFNVFSKVQRKFLQSL